jgi:hypothetical protein
MPQRTFAPNQMWWRPNPFPHRVNVQFPIDQCLLAAGSFIHDFRTPPAPETLQESGHFPGRASPIKEAT